MIKRTTILLLSTGLILNAFCGNDTKDSLDLQPTVQVPNEQKIGGSGVIEIGLTNLDLDPIKKITKEDLDKGGFNFDQNTFLTLGFIGYAGQRRNGMRFGLGGWAGYNSLYSDKWSSKASDSAIFYGSDTTVDSIIQLHLIFANAGLVVERSINLTKNFNIYAGGMFGGGALLAIEDRKLASGAFIKPNNNSDWQSDTVDTENRIAWAPVWAFDIHGGFAYSFTNWMHLGIDGSTLFNYSSRGFQSKYGSFWTVNPGIKLRLIFGTSV